MLCAFLRVALLSLALGGPLYGVALPAHASSPAGPATRTTFRSMPANGVAAVGALPGDGRTQEEEDEDGGGDDDAESPPPAPIPPRDPDDIRRPGEPGPRDGRRDEDLLVFCGLACLYSLPVMIVVIAALAVIVIALTTARRSDDDSVRALDRFVRGPRPLVRGLRPPDGLILFRF